MTRALIIAALILAALHVPITRDGITVTLYREIVCATPLDTMPLYLRFEILDRPSPFTTYNERE